ncbi:hypothetical protein IWW43_005345, partial [Coemansia sp. RSA 1935]
MSTTSEYEPFCSLPPANSAIFPTDVAATDDRGSDSIAPEKTQSYMSSMTPGAARPGTANNSTVSTSRPAMFLDK